jgi:hypothetical protein
VRTFIATITAITLSTGVIAATSTAAEAKGKFSVTASASRTQLTLGSSFTLSGKVSPSAKGKKVTIQERLGAGSWKNLTTKTLSSSSKYSATIKPRKAGAYSYRVVKAAGGSRAGGASVAKSVSIFRWRYLVDLPLSATVGNASEGTATIRGNQFDHSIRIGEGVADSGLTYLNQGCTAMTSIIGMGDLSAGDATASTGISLVTGSGEGPLYHRTFVATSEPRFYTTETGLTTAKQIKISATANSASAYAEIFWAEPQVYCKS